MEEGQKEKRKEGEEAMEGRKENEKEKKRGKKGEGGREGEKYQNMYTFYFYIQKITFWDIKLSSLVSQNIINIYPSVEGDAFDKGVSVNCF